MLCRWCRVDDDVLMVLCWWCCVERGARRRRRQRRRRDGARKTKTSHGNLGNNSLKVATCTLESTEGEDVSYIGSRCNLGPNEILLSLVDSMPFQDFDTFLPTSCSTLQCLQCIACFTNNKGHNKITNNNNIGIPRSTWACKQTCDSTRYPKEATR